MQKFLKNLLAPAYLLYYVVLYVMMGGSYKNVHWYTVRSVINCTGVIVMLFVQFLLNKLSLEVNTLLVVISGYVLFSWARLETDETNEEEEETDGTTTASS